MDPGIFSNLILARRFRKITATEQKFPSVSTAKGTTTEDGDLPFSHAYIIKSYLEMKIIYTSILIIF